MNFQLDHLEMEFGAETWWFCSPHEYYKTTEFQLQTPSSVATGNSIFLVRKFRYTKFSDP